MDATAGHQGGLMKHSRHRAADAIAVSRIAGAPRRSTAAMRVIHLAGYAGPYPGSFIAMIRAAAAACERRGFRSEAVFGPGAAARPWYSDLSRVMPVRAGEPDAGFIQSILDEEPGPAILHTHFTGFDLPALAAARRRPDAVVIWHLHTR